MQGWKRDQFGDFFNYLGKKMMVTIRGGITVEVMRSGQIVNLF